MKVLHLTSGNLFGGIETYLLTLARLRHLCPSMEPHFGVCFPGRLRDELTAAGVPVYDVGGVRVSRPWTVLRARVRLKRLLRESDPDAVVTHGTWPHAIFAPAVKRLGIRLLNAVHGELTGRHWIDRWAARTPPDAVIANSRFTAGTARRMFPDSPVSVVYPPIAAPEFSDRLSHRRAIRAEFETVDDAIVILIASRIEELKGHTVLIRALGELRAVGGWVCWVVGGAQRSPELKLLASLRASAHSLGIADRVNFLGQRKDIPRILAAADVYCQPNTGPEGFGIAFIEALSAGLPVVTSPIGGALEIVTEACGILCQPGNPSDFAKALRGIIEKPARRHELGAAGPSRASELCDPARQLIVLQRILYGWVA